MKNQVENNKRLAKNTILLYFRMIFSMLISLYTSRVILNALGVDDYGIYIAVGGFVAMFAVISNSLTAAVSRFITFELGVGNLENMRKVFSSSLIIQIIIAIIVAFISEIIGIWFLNSHMTIPKERLFVANWVFQFSLLTFVVNLISVPYNACIVAHEKMKAFAYIGILQSIGTLIIALVVKYSAVDRLFFYALMMFLLSVGIRFIYGWYCKINFQECKIIMWVWDKFLLKRIFSFAGWNFIGASSGVLRDQGTNVLLNIFCGPTVNAARGVALQVSSAVTQFSSSFITAINPQITKNYANKEYEYLFKLVFDGARFSVYLLLIMAYPILFETDMILSLWLKVVPPYTVVFVRLLLIYIIIESISYTMVTLMLATGNIRNYQIVVGGCQMLNFPISYMLLKCNYSPETTIIVSIIIAVGCLVLRLMMLHRMLNFPVSIFLKKVLGNILMVASISLIVPLVLVNLMDSSILRVFLSILFTCMSTLWVILRLGCTDVERSFIIEKIISKVKR